MFKMKNDLYIITLNQIIYLLLWIIYYERGELTINFKLSNIKYK